MPTLTREAHAGLGRSGSCADGESRKNEPVRLEVRVDSEGSRMPETGALTGGSRARARRRERRPGVRARAKGVLERVRGPGKAASSRPWVRKSAPTPNSREMTKEPLARRPRKDQTAQASALRATERQGGRPGARHKAKLLMQVTRHCEVRISNTYLPKSGM